MKTRFIIFSLFLTATLASCGGDANKTEEMAADTAAVTAPEPATEPAPPMDSAAMAKAWEAYMTPGDMHTWLASTDGTWSGEVKSWMAPDAPPTTSQATITAKMIMGGRYQQGMYKGTMMGMPFEGISMMAYDNARKEFVNTWIDNMGTGITMMTGKMDEASKTISFAGTMTDFSTGKDSKIRQVLKYPDANTQIMEMYCEQPGGGEMKMMEMTLTRK